MTNKVLEQIKQRFATNGRLSPRKQELLITTVEEQKKTILALQRALANTPYPQKPDAADTSKETANSSWFALPQLPAIPVTLPANINLKKIAEEIYE